MRLTLQSCLRSDGTPRPTTTPHQAAAVNKQSSPITGTMSTLQWVSSSHIKDCVIGDQVVCIQMYFMLFKDFTWSTLQVLYVHPPDHFNVHFPFRRGDLNIHSGVGGSLSSVLADLEAIWGHCIEKLLEIPRSDLKVNETDKKNAVAYILSNS